MAARLLAVAALAGCAEAGGEIFRPLHDASVPAGCQFPPASGRLAEWHADGTLRNSEPCSPGSARVVGAVPYGPSLHGQAWYFRSKATSSAGDPNYVAVSGLAGITVPLVTVDAWVRQGPFNAYADSNRLIVGTGWKRFQDHEPGEFRLYLHENQDVYFFAKAGRGYVDRVDWATCTMQARALPIDTWVRYTATYDGAMVRCYRDGVAVSEVDLVAPTDAGPIDDLVIGRNYPGDVDAVRVLSRVLSPQEIARPWP